MEMEDNGISRSKVYGCYNTSVSNGNDIWQSDSVLTFYLPTFAAQLAFMLFTNRCLYYLFRPFNQPRIVVEILVTNYVNSCMSNFNHACGMRMHGCIDYHLGYYSN